MNTPHILWRDLLGQVRLLPIVFFLLALPLSAQIPSLINYQGRLTDAQGNPVTGNRTMAVKIYDAPTGGNMTYQETIGTVAVKNGIYSFQFGDEGDGIIGVLIGVSDYLALSVNGTEETTRTRLLAVPYALKSADAQAMAPELSALTDNVESIQLQGAAIVSNLEALSANVSALQNEGADSSSKVNELTSKWRVIQLSGGIDFGDSQTQAELTITNKGFGELMVSEISSDCDPVSINFDPIFPYPPDYQNTQITNLPAHIPAGGSLSVLLRFNPTETLSYAGNLTVTSDATSGYDTIPVSGMGARLIELSGDLQFGEAPANIGGRRILTISNCGTMDLEVTGINYPAGFSGDWSGTIPPGGRQDLEVTFMPTDDQFYSGTLSIESNATGGSGEMEISGSGLNLTPAIFVDVAPGSLPINSSFSGTYVSAFQIGKFEVTWAEWQEVRDWAVQNGYNDLAGVGAGTDGNYPVTDVGWSDVLKWLNARSELEGRTPVYHVYGQTYKNDNYGSYVQANPSANGYRLPTEQEWEWAARGGVNSSNYTYSGSNDLSEVGWYSAISGGDTKAVGILAANELGIHDMSGNVWELCWQDYFWNYWNSYWKSIRGGAWNYEESYSNVGYRGGNPGDRTGFIGFRLARNAE